VTLQLLGGGDPNHSRDEAAKNYVPAVSVASREMRQRGGELALGVR